MEQEILQDIKDYLGDDYRNYDESSLLFCVKRAIKSFSSKRNYPDSYSENAKSKDMDKFYMCIFDLALYWCNLQGVEFQNSHSENGVSQSWKSESDIYVLHNVIPLAKII